MIAVSAAKGFEHSTSENDVGFSADVMIRRQNRPRRTILYVPVLLDSIRSNMHRPVDTRTIYNLQLQNSFTTLSRNFQT